MTYEKKMALALAGMVFGASFAGSALALMIQNSAQSKPPFVAMIVVGVSVSAFCFWYRNRWTF